MKLSSNTTSVLKNFASINQNLVIKEGKEITTMSAMKNIVARAEVEEEFPQEVAIYDLNEFLSALSLFKSPNLEFQDTYVNITEENNPKSSPAYFSGPGLVSQNIAAWTGISNSWSSIALLNLPFAHAFCISEQGLGKILPVTEMHPCPP